MSGAKLFTSYLLPFEVTSVLILIAHGGRDRAGKKGNLTDADHRAECPVR